MMRLPFRPSALLLTAVCVALPGGVAAANNAPTSEEVLQRLDRIERSLNNQSLLDMYTQLQSLQSQVRELRGQLETQQHRLSELIEQQKKLYTDTDTRLQALESQTAGNTANSSDNDLAADDPATNGSDATGSTGNVADGSTGGANAAPPTGNPDRARVAYDQALELLKAGQYKPASDAFNQYLKQYPNSEYTDNAYYWLGESYYVTRDFENAISAYRNVLSQYPNSQKAPHALLKIGFSQQELGNTEQARTTLEEVRSRYPDTTAASLAGERLQQR